MWLTRWCRGEMFECRGVPERVAEEFCCRGKHTHETRTIICQKWSKMQISQFRRSVLAAPGCAPELVLQFGVRFGGAGMVHRNVLDGKFCLQITNRGGK